MNLLLQVAPLHCNSKALIVIAAAEVVEYTSAEPLLFSLLTKTSKAPPTEGSLKRSRRGLGRFTTMRPDARHLG